MRVFLACLFLCLAPAVFAGNVLVLGDSLGAAYGVKRESGWVYLLNDRVATVCPGADVYNASVSGETTAGGRARLPELLERREPDIVVIELGGNDGLRGLSVQRLRANLVAMIEESRNAGAEVLLLGMRIPFNYGFSYTKAFADTFDTVAEQESVAYVPFFLDGVALNPRLMQPDQIHPNAAAQPIMLDNVWPTLKPLVESQCDNRELTAEAQSRGE